MNAAPVNVLDVLNRIGQASGLVEAQTAARDAQTAIRELFEAMRAERAALTAWIDVVAVPGGIGSDAYEKTSDDWGSAALRTDQALERCGVKP